MTPFAFAWILLALVEAAEGPQIPPPRGRDDATARNLDHRRWFGPPAGIAYLDHKKAQAKAFLASRPAQRALSQRRESSSGTALPALTNTWQSLGPVRGASTYTPEGSEDVDSGRLVAIVPHPLLPKTLYVAAAGGGVWKCTNADPEATLGEWTWTSITDNLPASSGDGNPSPGALAINPMEAQVLYLGLGDPIGQAAAGRGFFISPDAGETWREGGSLGPTTRVTKIVPLDDGQTILVGGNAGLWRSTDAGNSFTNIPLGASLDGTIWALEKMGPKDLVLSRNSATTVGTIWTSGDAGATWTQATLDPALNPLSLDRISLAATPADPRTVYGIHQVNGTRNLARGVLKSTDGGKSWAFLAAPTVPDGLFQAVGPSMEGDGGQGEYNQFLAVDPTDPNKVFVAANLALYRSLDGGRSWNSLTAWIKGQERVYGASDFHTAAWATTGSKTLFVGNDGGLFLLRDPDRAKVPATPDVTFYDGRRGVGLATHLVYHLACTSAPAPTDAPWRVLAGMQDLGVRVRAGTGEALSTSKTFDDTAQIGDGFGVAIHPKNGDVMLASAYYCAFKQSTDGGRTWTSANTGLAEAGDGTKAPFHTRLTLGLADPTGQTVYTFTHGTVYRSGDFGTSWSPLPMGGFDPKQSIRAMAASATDPNLLAVVTSADTGFLSTDGGGTWTPFGPFPVSSPGYFSAISIGSGTPQVLYVASVAQSAAHSHVFKSADGGQTWTALDGAPTASNGFPFGIPVHVLQEAPDGTLLAGTDFGLVRSSDGGASWQRYGQDLPLIAVRDLAVAADGSWVRIGTYGRGIWELPAVEPFLLRVSPSTAQMRGRQTQTFTAAVRGLSDTGVTWSLPEGPSSGTLSGSGSSVTYTAPEGRGTYTLQATSTGDPSRSVTVKIHVR